MIDSLKKANKVILKLQKGIMVISSCAVVSMIFIGAIMRYIFKVDFYGMEELVLLFAFWLYFMGSSYAAYEDSHINADLLSSFIEDERKLKILATVKYGLSLLLSILVTKWCIEFIMWNLKMNPTTPIYNIPIVTSQSAIAISFILMTIYTLAHFIESIKTLKK